MLSKWHGSRCSLNFADAALDCPLQSQNLAHWARSLGGCSKEEQIFEAYQLETVWLEGKCLSASGVNFFYIFGMVIAQVFLRQYWNILALKSLECLLTIRLTKLPCLSIR